MKTLKNQTLLYDEDCPMCNLYTAGFIKTKMMDENGRKPFVAITEGEQEYIDIQRATNEIALVNHHNKTVIYGIDSLLTIIGHSFPWMKKIGTTQPIYFLLKKLYKFISYNRKVIIPSRKKENSQLQCVPDFNFTYRYLYLVFATVITVLTLYKCASILIILPKASMTREIALAVGQIGFQLAFLTQNDYKTNLNYIGNLLTVSLMGALILLPMIVFNEFINVPQLVILGWFGMTVLIMVLEHFRRVKILQLPHYLTATWIVYRLLALLIILNF
ncbi:MAG: DUF393 domain-containing protein [Flavobacterium sp.]|nr:DUF393 domain-containing protein [Flavobacterium sp.]